MHDALAAALAQRGYDTLTDVQNAVSNPDLSGADLLVSAQTGSGKTVGFGIAIADTLLGEAPRFGPAGSPLALIVAPTRELAMQVMREIGWLYAEAGAQVVSCVGGMDQRSERRALERGAHLVVGTPGRLCDHIRRGALDLSDIRAVVLDEADEMLDLGFREDLEFMLSEAPETRRTLLFSATVPPMIETLAQTFQRDAVRISTQTSTRQHADITYQALQVAQVDAENAITNVLRYHDAPTAIVFANTRATVARLTARLSNRGFSVVSLSGELSQQERTNALQAMRDGRARVCVATDVAARGIDLPNLELVIHADLPTGSETLLHRSGRTGRAGRKGVSALIVPPKMAGKAKRLLKWAKIDAEWTTAPSADEIEAKDVERLLADPVWDEAASDDGLAARLLEAHGAEAVARACLKFYRGGLSAPEDLADPDARPERKPREDFGESRWVSLSVGRGDRAEPRWLLPMLCRAGGLAKADIGAIRIADKETFVELKSAAHEAFLARMGDGGELEDGIAVSPVEGVPDTRPQGRGPSRGPNRGPERNADRRDDRGPGKPRHAGRPKGPRPPKDFDPSRGGAVKAGAPKRGPGDKPRSDKPRSDKPRSDKPSGKPGGKPKSAKFGAMGKTGGGGHKPGGKPGGKPFGKPGPKAGGKPKAKPHRKG